MKLQEVSFKYCSYSKPKILHLGYLLLTGMHVDQIDKIIAETVGFDNNAIYTIKHFSYIYFQSSLDTI